MPFCGRLSCFFTWDGVNAIFLIRSRFILATEENISICGLFSRWGLKAKAKSSRDQNKEPMYYISRQLFMSPFFNSWLGCMGTLFFRWEESCQSGGKHKNKRKRNDEPLAACKTPTRTPLMDSGLRTRGVTRLALHQHLTLAEHRGHGTRGMN